MTERAHSPAAAVDEPRTHGDELALDPGKITRSEALRRPADPILSGLILRRAAGGSVGADASSAVAAATSSSGARLPSTVQQLFERSLGADLSGVRVHTGSESMLAAHAVRAKAYALGNDIHFAAGQYDPASASGLHLLAHEVAHTVQQAGAPQRVQYALEVSSPGDALEHEADRAADAMIAGRPATVSSAGRAIQRAPDPAAEAGAAASEWTPVPLTKKTKRSDVCFEHAPPRPPSLLDDLLPPSREEALRRIAAAIARDQELVIGALPLGGVYVGSRGNYRHAVGVDNFEIQTRTLAAMTTMTGAVSATVLRLRGADDITIMQGAETSAAIEYALGALTSAGGGKRAPPPRTAPVKQAPHVVTIPYSKGMKKNPGQANFFRLCIEWVQEAVELKTGARAKSDAAARVKARVTMTNAGVDVRGKDAAHPLDSIINIHFDPATGAYYFADQSVNRAFGRYLQGLGKLPPGTPIRIEFEGFPGYDKVPPETPPTTP